MVYYPTVAAGDVLTADLLQKFATLGAIKSADETITSNATYQDDDHLSVVVAANATYAVDLNFVYNSNTTANFKWQLSIPAGATLSGFWSLWLNGTTITWLGGLSTGVTALNGHATNDLPVIVKVGLFVGATPGNCTLQWAQNTSNASNTTVRKGSYLNLIRMA